MGWLEWMGWMDGMGWMDDVQNLVHLYPVDQGCLAQNRLVYLEHASWMS